MFITVSNGTRINHNAVQAYWKEPYGPTQVIVASGRVVSINETIEEFDALMTAADRKQNTGWAIQHVPCND